MSVNGTARCVLEVNKKFDLHSLIIIELRSTGSIDSLSSISAPKFPANSVCCSPSQIRYNRP